MKDIFIAGIGPLNGGEVRALLGYYGDVRSVGISVNHQTGKPRGYAFATMADPEGAAAVIAALNDAEYNGRKLRVEYQKEWR